MKKYIPLLLIILLALFFRFMFLRVVPIGISDDELDYVFNSKAVFLTGHDVTGEWNPLSFTTPPIETPKGELLYMIIAPFIGPLRFSLFNARLPFVFFNIGLVIILYLLAKKLFDEKKAIFVGLVAAVNPWMIYFSRTSFDAPVAIFFYLLSLLIIISARGWRIFYSAPFLLIAFYTYIGTKVIFIPFVFIALLYSIHSNYKGNIKSFHIALFAICMIIFSYFILSMYTNNNSVAGRTSEIYTPFSNFVEDHVISDRKNSLDNPFQFLFSNKLTVWSVQITEKYFGAFLIGQLFLHGDVRSTFSVWTHGMFYYIEFFFLLIGIFSIYKSGKKASFLLLALVAIAPIPTMLSSIGVTYPIRSALLYPILIIFIGCGIATFLEYFKMKKVLVGVLLVLYLILISNFMYIYLFRNPVYNSEGFGFSGRVLSNYVELADEKNKQIWFITKKPQVEVLKQYLFYTDAYNRGSSEAIKKAFISGTYSYGNFKQVPCPKMLPNNVTAVSIYDSKCPVFDGKNLSIAQLSDGGQIYKISNDSLCSDYDLKRFPNRIRMSDLSIRRLGEQKFCETFITDLN